MTIKISYINNKYLKNTKNLTLFSDENLKIFNLKFLGLPNQNIINELIQNNNEKKKKILHLNLNKKQNLIIIKTNKKHQTNIYNEKLGAEFYDFINSNSINNLLFFDQNFLDNSLNKNFID